MLLEPTRKYLWLSTFNVESALDPKDPKDPVAVKVPHKSIGSIDSIQCYLWSTGLAPIDGLRDFLFSYSSLFKILSFLSFSVLLCWALHASLSVTIASHESTLKALAVGSTGCAFRIAKNNQTRASPRSSPGSRCPCGKLGRDARTLLVRFPVHILLIILECASRRGVVHRPIRQSTNYFELYWLNPTGPFFPSFGPPRLFDGSFIPQEAR